MFSRYSRGSITRIYLDIIAAGVGITGQVPTCAIQRATDSKWFKKADATWQLTAFENPMVETSLSNFPGRYHLDFDQSKDTDITSAQYIARKTNTDVTYRRLEYDDLSFVPLSGAVAPGLCAVTGTIYSGQARAARQEDIRATLVPVFKDALGRGIQSDRVILATTTDTGDFSIALVRGATFRLEIPAIGYDRKVTIPDQSSVLFTAL